METWIIYKNLSSREEEIRIGNLKDKNLERRGRSKVWDMENLKVETIEMSKIGNNGKLILWEQLGFRTEREIEFEDEKNYIYRYIIWDIKKIWFRFIVRCLLPKSKVNKYYNGKKKKLREFNETSFSAHISNVKQYSSTSLICSVLRMVNEDLIKSFSTIINLIIKTV